MAILLAASLEDDELAEWADLLRAALPEETLVTDRAGDVNSPSQVGESGPVKAIFDSFALGSSGAAK